MIGSIWLVTLINELKFEHSDMSIIFVVILNDESLVNSGGQVVLIYDLLVVASLVSKWYVK